MQMATSSLNQVRKEITDFARSHGQIFTAKFSRQGELLEAGDRLYPALYYDLKRMRKERNELVMSFTAWIADRILAERDNEAEVWSDTILIACDMLAFLDADDRDYKLADVTEMSRFTQATGELVAGVSFDFTIRLPFPYDRCNIPTSANGFLITEDGDPITTQGGQNIAYQ